MEQFDRSLGKFFIFGDAPNVRLAGKIPRKLKKKIKKQGFPILKMEGVVSNWSVKSDLG